MKKLLSIRIRSLAVFLFLACNYHSLAVADTSRDATIRKAIPYLKAEGTKWMDKRGCVSCHQVPFMLWSLSEAHRHGFDVDTDELKKWKSWSVDVVNFVKPAKKESVDHAKTMAANIDTMSALMLAMQDDLRSQWSEKFSKALLENQKPIGSWKSCGQLPSQKRPKEETEQVTALWTVLALAKANTDVPESAIQYVDQETDSVSTESWVAKILVANQLGRDAQANALRQELVSQQNDDGGWGWIKGKPSDALATGMAIYAVTQLPSNQTDDFSKVLADANQFLKSTQKSDGSWSVHGTKKSTQSRATPTSNYWGTAWAVIGILSQS